MYRYAPNRNINDLPPPPDHNWAGTQRKVFAHLEATGLSSMMFVSVPITGRVRDIHGALYYTQRKFANRGDGAYLDLRPEVDAEKALWLFVFLRDPVNLDATYELERVAHRDGRIEVRVRLVPLEVLFWSGGRYLACWLRLPPEVVREWMEIVVTDERSPVPLMTRRVEVRK